jgi:hypothetical protein
VSRSEPYENQSPHGRVVSSGVVHAPRH